MMQFPIKENKLRLAVLFLWFAIQAILWWKNGIVIDGEAEKYISEAHTFLEIGSVSSSNFWLYIIQIILIAFSIKFNLSFVFVVVIQLLVNLFSVAAVYYFIRSLFNTKLAFIIVILLLLNYPLQQFNTFLQTESLFYSFITIYSCYLLHIKKIGLKEILIICFSLLLISVTRPTGLLFIPPTFLYLFFRFFTNIPVLYKTSLVILTSLLFLFILNFALGSGGELDFMLPFRDERIICGVPTVKSFLPIETSEDGNSLYGLAYYIANNFDQFSRLALIRALTFFKLFRPYFSTGHNIYLIIFFFPIYLSVLFSLRHWLKNNAYFLLYCISIIFMVLLTVMLTCDDWHNRFFLTITPFLNFLSLPFILKILNKFHLNDNH